MINNLSISLDISKWADEFWLCSIKIQSSPKFNAEKVGTEQEKCKLQLSPLWLTSIHSGQASLSTKFCSKISHEILQVWSCTASFAQPTQVTSPLKDWLQDFNPVLQHFHQLFSRLYRSASIRLHPFQTSPFILGHTHPAYSFHWKLSHLVKEHSPSQAQLSGIYWLMDSNTESSLAFKTTLKTHLFRSAYY